MYNVAWVFKNLQFHVVMKLVLQLKRDTSVQPCLQRTDHTHQQTAYHLGDASHETAVTLK